MNAFQIAIAVIGWALVAVWVVASLICFATFVEVVLRDRSGEVAFRVFGIGCAITLLAMASALLTKLMIGWAA